MLLNIIYSVAKILIKNKISVFKNNNNFKYKTINAKKEKFQQNTTKNAFLCKCVFLPTRITHKLHNYFCVFAKTFCDLSNFFCQNKKLSTFTQPLILIILFNNKKIERRTQARLKHFLKLYNKTNIKM